MVFNSEFLFRTIKDYNPNGYMFINLTCAGETGCIPGISNVTKF